jgi:hypothetical protein
VEFKKWDASHGFRLHFLHLLATLLCESESDALQQNDKEPLSRAVLLFCANLFWHPILAYLGFEGGGLISVQVHPTFHVDMRISLYMCENHPCSPTSNIILY